MIQRKLFAPGRMYMVKVREGEEVHEVVRSLMEAQGIESALVTGIGGFSEAVIGFFSPSRNKYLTVEVKPREGLVIEVASLDGNAVSTGGSVSVHLHAVLSLDPKTVIAGHLVKGVARPHVELFLIEALGRPGAALEVLDHRKGPAPGLEQWPGSQG